MHPRYHQNQENVRHDVSAFSWIRSSKDSDNGHTVSYKAGPPENVRTSPSMEKTFEDLNNNSVLNLQSSEHNFEEAIKKACENFAAITSIRDSRTIKTPT